MRRIVRTAFVPLAISLLLALYVALYVGLGTTWEILDVGATGEEATVEGILREYKHPLLAEVFRPAAWVESLVTRQPVETSN